METKFECLAFSAKKYLPPNDAIYFIVCEKRVLYIGTTKNLNKRFRQHHLNFCLSRFENPYIIWFGNKNQPLELSLISIYRPLFNQRKHLNREILTWKRRKETNIQIVDKRDALKIFNISIFTLSRWEDLGIVHRFTSIYRGRKRICYDAKILKDIVSASESVA